MNEFKITFSQSDMHVLQSALVEMPFRVAAPLIDKINAQIQKAHDDAADDRGAPSGAVKQPDQYRGD